MVDLEPFKGHSYPDLLLSVLIATFRSFKEWLESAATARLYQDKVLDATLWQYSNETSIR